MTLPVGRFAPSPTGRMHLGNVYAALMSWLSVKRRGGRWILRIEDLDAGRSRPEYALELEDDLRWLGLQWDEGGTADLGPNGPYSQSRRGPVYAAHLDRLTQMRLTYPCTCTRAEIMATQAPHASDGAVIYGGRCRPEGMPRRADFPAGRHSVRLWVPDRDVCFTDRNFGPQRFNLARDCGDFILQRADGAWAYQLAVVVDDALMGITEVVRGEDLLPSSAMQIYLYELLGYPVPEFAHIPLLRNALGQRLAKRDRAQNLAQLRPTHTPEAVAAMVLTPADLADYLRLRHQ